MDIWTAQKRSEVMSRIRSKGNKTTELSLVSELRRLGINGWRRHISVSAQDFCVKPDFVFASEKVAIFVDGCFWHCCPIHGTSPKSNRDFWKKKLLSNKIRDLRVNDALQKSGWRVLRFWEHETKSRSEICAGKILIALFSR